MLIGIHGAALANLYWLHPDAVLVEVYPVSVPGKDIWLSQDGGGTVYMQACAAIERRYIGARLASHTTTGKGRQPKRNQTADLGPRMSRLAASVGGDGAKLCSDHVKWMCTPQPALEHLPSVAC